MAKFAQGDLLFAGRDVGVVLAVNANSYDVKWFEPGQGFVTTDQAAVDFIAVKMTLIDPPPAYMPPLKKEIMWRTNGCVSKAEGGTAPLVGDPSHTVVQGYYNDGTPGDVKILTEDGDSKSRWIVDIEVVAVLDGPPTLP